MITLIKKQFKAFLLIGSAITVTASIANTTPKLSEAYISLQSNTQQLSDFFQVMVAADNENTPYLNVEATLHSLSVEVVCNQSHSQCTATLQPDNQIFTINAATKTYTAKGVTYPLANGALVEKDNALWLKYDAWKNWLPMRIDWSLESYKVVIHPRFQLLDDLKKRHKQSLEEAKSDNKAREKLAAADARWPTSPWNLELSPQLTLSQATDGEFIASPSLYTNIDIFKGTFSGSISSSYSSDSQWSNPDYSWYYKHQDQQGNNLFELGDIYIDNSLLIPGYSLDNGFSYQRFPTVNQQTNGSFTYHGITEPNTEVDIWRNGFLRKIMYADSSGRYLIKDSGAKSGDVYTLVFFFKNGSKIEKTITIAGENPRLGKGEINPQIWFGKQNSIQYQYAGLSYGLTPELSLGLYAMEANTDDQNGVGSKLIWQLNHDLNLSGETFSSQSGNDYGLLLSYTGIANNQLALLQRKININSPLRLDNTTAPTVLFSNLPFDYIDELNPTRWTTLQNNYSVDSTTLSLSARFTDSYQDQDLSISHSFNSTFSGQLQGGSIRTITDNQRNPWASYQLFVNLPLLGSFNAQEYWVRNNPSLNGFNLNYYLSLGNEQPLTLSATYTKTQADDTWNASMTWQYSPNVSFSLSGNQDDFTFGVSLSDIIGPNPHPEDSTYFNNATLTGRLMQPALDGSPAEPVAGVKLEVGGQPVITNQDGYYTVAVPTYQRLDVKIDMSTLPANLVLAKSSSIFEMRPSTYEIYNPELSWSGGFDAQLFYLGGVPKGLQASIINLDINKQIRVVKVEPQDGFIMAEGLIPGRYELKLMGVKNPPTPLKFTIPESSLWASALRWYWGVTKKQVTETSAS
ncbi:hypothetical protein Psal006b_01614 [Piscirickettsia salmonis]|uniref:Carboxypeptidase regulatory-like domain protein n=1 Tax=Piscirickettsia salmonis TaxID=1238 RepID=A0A1L6TBY5_PISSA|nr:hypothetical protein [Piscirickettsia salmonis]AKP73947.1 hypothetical protein PSLF89_2205 [Piscirickettsia salmonis LF-89 = ATCC VR-1361]ALB22776.1 carboxypeptidase regulatory-like domain protein [Piscirickettsia salmonis]ALY02766.1 hypothetical protein AWE47_07810 [Piscirickettsia salmonis]AMA42314.1 hypothetical protein AWJ11_07995 [Piscirickettsia salmonis]AOS34788.1 hypothetical protein AVM72_05155 [Piscirickettsia salmonis]